MRGNAVTKRGRNDNKKKGGRMMMRGETMKSRSETVEG